MRKTDTAVCEPQEAPAAEAAKNVGRVMAARAALGLMRRRAQDMRARAQGLAVSAPRQAREAVARRRTATAARLESLADAIRPLDQTEAARARRKTAMIAGGSTLALAAALGAGVALGMFISRRLQKRRAERARPEGPAPGTERPPAISEPTVFADAGGLPH